MRFYDPDRGAVRLDGTDLPELALSDVRESLAVVLQETLVFHGTVRENIAYGRPGATDAEIVAAARAADAHDFIRLLPYGYDTMVGQRGRTLSGGQRQRLAIARAMIRDAPVLLLDEPTTGLDARSGQRVMDPLRRLMTGRTTVVISHNLLTVRDATRIVVLDHGRVLETGTHDDLLARGGAYAGLHRLHAVPGPVRAGRPAAGDGAVVTGTRTRVRAPTAGGPAPPLAPGTRPAPGYEDPRHLTRTGWLDLYDTWSEERACRCVVKVVRPDRRDKAVPRARLLREGRWLCAFSHPHLVRAYETLERPEPLVVLETLTGETLSHLVHRLRRRAAACDVALLGVQLCSAVHYLHGRGLLHLDLKPSNVVVDCGHAKVLDLECGAAAGARPGRLGHVPLPRAGAGPRRPADGRRRRLGHRHHVVRGWRSGDTPFDPRRTAESTADGDHHRCPRPG